MRPEAIVREMRHDDEYFVATCSHTFESAEIDEAAAKRGELLDALRHTGARFKVALQDREPVGFIHGIPIEASSWGPIGEGLLVVPCLYVLPQAAGANLGRRLLDAIVADAKREGRGGVVVTAYTGTTSETFMPAAYFSRQGFEEVEARGQAMLLWMRLHDHAAPPRLLEPHYVYRPDPERVAVDLFWNGFCQTSAIEARRVREVVAEFGQGVVLREFCAEDRDTLKRYQIPRAIFVNGEEVFWGHEAPKVGVRKAIEKAREAMRR